MCVSIAASCTSTCSLTSGSGVGPTSQSEVVSVCVGGGVGLTSQSEVVSVCVCVGGRVDPTSQSEVVSVCVWGGVPIYTLVLLNNVHLGRYSFNYKCIV